MTEGKHRSGRQGQLLLLTGIFNEHGGIASFSRSLLRALADSTSEPITAVLLNDPAVPQEHDLKGRIRFVPSAVTRSRSLWKIRFAASVFREYRRMRPKLVICAHINFVPVCLLLKLFGADYVVVTYGTEAWNIRSRAVKYGLRLALRVLSISRYTGDRVRQQVSIPSDRLMLLPPTYDESRFFPAPRSLELMRRLQLNDEKVLLTVARLCAAESYKGYEVVLRALRTLLDGDKRLCYVIVGSGDDLPQVQKLADELGVSKHVFFAGYVADADLAAYYNLADVFVMPSRGEGFGIVFLEALACGKPVISGNQDGSVDAVIDGQVGTLIDPSDEDALAMAIHNVLNARVERRLINPEYLRESVRQNFGYERFRARVQELLLNGSRESQARTTERKVGG